MAKEDFKCKVCREVKTFGIFSKGEKFSCPKCGTLCREHVSVPLLFGSSSCNICGNKVIHYKYDSEKKKYKQV